MIKIRQQQMILPHRDDIFNGLNDLHDSLQKQLNIIDSIKKKSLELKAYEIQAKLRTVELILEEARSKIEHVQSDVSQKWIAKINNPEN